MVNNKVMSNKTKYRKQSKMIHLKQKQINRNKDMYQYCDINANYIEVIVSQILGQSLWGNIRSKI